MMSFHLKCGRLLRLPAALGHKRHISANRGLVLGVYGEDGKNLKLTPAAENYNSVTNGKLMKFIELAGDGIKEGKSYVFWDPDAEFKSVAVVGLGPADKGYDPIERVDEKRENVRLAASAGCKALQSAGIKSIAVESLGDAEAAAEGSTLALWKFQEYKLKKSEPPTIRMFEKSANEDWDRGVVKANAQNTARRLMDTPANLMTPTIFSENVLEIFKGLGVDVQVHDQKWAEGKKMNSFLSVTRGSVEPPKFVELSYKGDDSAPIVFVGKGVTFDAGGISLKPSAAMDEMRADMGGAACVVGALQAIAQLKLQKHMKVLIPLVENLPSGSATKPGDVIRAMNGKSICVDNTDAEGRLILADALCYSAEFKPRFVLDIATLTGAIRVALGNSATGVFANNDKVFEGLERAGAITGDRVWRMPLWKHYTKQVSDYPAFDLNNVGKGKGGGSCTAAAFLKEFVPANTDWMHLDIAGVMGPGDASPYLSGMTGRPTRTLIEFVNKFS